MSPIALITGFLLASFASSIITQDISSPCRNFILADCDSEAAGCRTDTITNTEDSLTCSEFCNAYPDCQSWAHHKREQICELIQCPISHWSKFCKEFGGPREPDLSSCPSLDQGCDAHRSSYCPLTGPIAVDITVDSPKTCQLACQISHNGGNQCTHYLYNSADGCTMYDSLNLDCDVVIGPSDPVLDDCTDAPITTTTPIPTTTTPEATTTTTPEATTTTPEVTTTTPEPTTTTTLAPIDVIVYTSNAVTGRVLPEVSVVYSVTTPDEGDFDGSGLTDNDNGLLGIGTYPVGSVIEAEGTKDGFLKATTNITVTSDENPMKVALSLSPADGSNRIVLTWGTNPEDLDLHLVEYKPNDNLDGVCHVYWSDKVCDAHNGTRLDTDNLMGGDNGPETITINDPGMGDLYMVYVQDYRHNNTHPMYTSDAQIELYMNTTGSYSKVEIPTEGKVNDIYWFVGCFKGSEELLDDFKIVNELSPLSPYVYNKTKCLDLFPE